MSKPTNVRLWMNGMAMVFDENGEQIPELQGPWSYTLPEVLSRADAPSLTFYVGEWNMWMHRVARMQIEALVAGLWGIPPLRPESQPTDGSGPPNREG